MQLKLFRSLWGLEQRIAQAGMMSVLQSIADSDVFHGVELSLGDACGGSIAQPALDSFAAGLSSTRLETIIGVYSSWQDYGCSGWERLSVQQHVDNFERQLALIADAVQAGKLAQPRLVNAHSGCDSFTEAQQDAYFQAVLPLGSRYGLLVAHETHRSRCLASPWATLRLTRAHPELLLTADLSHWAVVSERLLESEPEQALLDEVAPRVRHVHGRVGTAQHAQLDELPPTDVNSLLSRERLFFEKAWASIWSAQRAAGLSVSTLTPEYGPVGSGYSTSTREESVSELIIVEAQRQLKRFRVLDRAAQFAAEATPLRPVVAGNTGNGIPLVDVSSLLDPDASMAQQACAGNAIHAACIEHGFLYVVQHGIPASTLADVLAGCRSFFFEQPAHVKDTIHMKLHPSSGRGYQNLLQNTTYGSLDLHQGVDFMVDFSAQGLPAVVQAALAGTPSVYAEILAAPNQWPPAPAYLSDALRSYAAGATRVGHALVRGLALGVGLPADYFSALFADPFWSMRMIGYPSQSDAADVLARLSGTISDAATDRSVGVGEHSDYGCFTILNVDPLAENTLQVKNKDGVWVRGDPLPGALVCNIGDLLSLWSAGMYQSTPHRVLNHATRQRVSVPFFFDPVFTAPAAVLPEFARVAALQPQRAAFQARLQQVEQRMNINPGSIFGHYHLKKVSTNFKL